MRPAQPASSIWISPAEPSSPEDFVADEHLHASILRQSNPCVNAHPFYICLPPRSRRSTRPDDPEPYRSTADVSRSTPMPRGAPSPPSGLPRHAGHPRVLPRHFGQPQPPPRRRRAPARHRRRCHYGPPPASCHSFRLVFLDLNRHAVNHGLF